MKSKWMRSLMPRLFSMRTTLPRLVRWIWREREEKIKKMDSQGKERRERRREGGGSEEGREEGRVEKRRG